MLKLFDKDKNAMGHIYKYTDCKIESDVGSGDKTLSFTYQAKDHTFENEMYVRTRDDEYVIKEISENSDGFPELVCALNLEDLEAKAWMTFTVTDTTITDAAQLALAGTGWRVGECTITKQRNAGMVNVNSLEVIQKLCTAFMCEPVFDTINKTVSFYEEQGEDKGVYFITGLNLKKLQKKTSSYDFYTQIIPIGADGLTIESVNDGKNYLENYQYSEKTRVYIWNDSSYTDAAAMMEDAAAYLEGLSKPEVSYSADVRDLAAQKPEYSILSYGLGDTVTLIDPNTGTREKQRIKKMTIYPQEPDNNTCEISNTFLTFEELQDKLQAAADIIGYTVTNDGKIYVSQILGWDSSLDSAISGNSTIASLNSDLAALKLTVGEVTTNMLTADQADIKYATVEQLNVTNETVHSIQGDYAAFKTATADEFAAQNGIIDNLSGQFSSYHVQMAQELVAAKGWMAEGSIGSAQIQSLDVNKLEAGTIDTARISLASQDSALQVTGSQILVNDTTDALNPYNRVILGKYKDASGGTEYGLLVRSADGQTVMIDGEGVHNAGITDGAIDNNKVADDANISSYKIDLRTINEAMTEQGVRIDKTVVRVGDKSLEVVLKEQTQEITDTVERIGEIEAQKMYRVETYISGRQIFTDKGQAAVMSCRVLSWDEDITDTLDSSLFSWHRASGDAGADAEWDSYHAGMKQINITTEDVMDNASFYCEVTI